MNFQINGWNNFCRVFQLPDSYPDDYCFNGSISKIFKMVDWFNPIGMDTTGRVYRTQQQLFDTVGKFVLKKSYIQKGCKYLILCDFGAALVVEKSNEDT